MEHFWDSLVHVLETGTCVQVVAHDDSNRIKGWGGDAAFYL